MTGLQVIFGLKVLLNQQQEKRNLEDLVISKRVSSAPVMTRSTHASLVRSVALLSNLNKNQEMHSYKRFDDLLQLNNNDDSADEDDTLLRKPKSYWSPSPAYKNIVRSIKILIIVVIVLGLVGLGIYFVVHFDSKDNNTNDKSPTVKIAEATSVTAHTAILNGHIVADGSQDKFRYYFLYETSFSSNQTAAVNVASNYNGGVSCMVGYLQANETYSYSLVLEMEPDDEDDDWSTYTSAWAYFTTLDDNSTSLYILL